VRIPSSPVREEERYIKRERERGREREREREIIVVFIFNRNLLAPFSYLVNNKHKITITAILSIAIKNKKVNITETKVNNTFAYCGYAEWHYVAYIIQC
jgi:hypothetical protein